jgi:5-methylcytosine-specific restriction endonuclease McrA
MSRPTMKQIGRLLELQAQAGQISTLPETRDEATAMIGELYKVVRPSPPKCICIGRNGIPVISYPKPVKRSGQCSLKDFAPLHPDVRWDVVRSTCLCHYCRKRIPMRNRTVDHRLPRSRGGTNERSNLVMSCKICNNVKGSRTEEEWRDEGMNTEIARQRAREKGGRGC